MFKNRPITAVAATAFIGALAVTAAYAGGQVGDDVIAAQRAALAAATDGKGYGPQSPRDIDNLAGANSQIFGQAPAHNQLNLCNIHFHKNAEHKGGDFDRYAGNGDGKGYGGGYIYSGELTDAEKAPLPEPVADHGHGGLQPGDTIEVHYVYTTASVGPGQTLGACLHDAVGNPQLRVETQVFVLVNDKSAADFMKLAEVGVRNGYSQALNIPDNTGAPVQYEGSTTGPGYNEKGSPFQVSWSVRPRVAKLNIHSVAEWLEGNVFGEDHAHGVRNLVFNANLLSVID